MSLSNKAYTLAQKEHLAECEQDLDTLKKRLEQGGWSRLERAAAERTLQVLIESCIGIAKHWARATTGHLAAEPRKAVEALRDHGLIDHSLPWNKVIGLRNVLVHDYLEVDVSILEAVVREEHYQSLLAFAHQGLNALHQSDSTTPQ